MQARYLVRASMLVTLVWCEACHAEAKVNASTDDDNGFRNEPATTPAPAATTPAPAQTVSAPAAPPGDACPLFCHEARGSVRAEMTAEEMTQLRTSLEPVLGRMRQCTSAEEWRRYGSAVVNLRIAPDGQLAELGVDPHHGHFNSCFDDVGRSSGAGASLSLPGRKVVRCAERCVRETPRRRNNRVR